MITNELIAAITSVIYFLCFSALALGFGINAFHKHGFPHVLHLTGRWLSTLALGLFALVCLDGAAYRFNLVLPVLGRADGANFMVTTNPLRVLSGIVLIWWIHRLFTKGLTDGVA